MTPTPDQLEKLRVAVAELCGWKRCEPCKKNCYDSWRRPDDQGCQLELPDYSTSIDAMHCAESTLNENQREVFAGLMTPEWDDYDRAFWREIWDTTHSEPWQRALAFVRTHKPDYEL